MTLSWISSVSDVTPDMGSNMASAGQEVRRHHFLQTEPSEAARWRLTDGLKI